jgi:hypothetical protein
MTNSGKKLCSYCEEEMLPGCLRVGGDSVYMNKQNSRENISVDALFCPACGFIEFWADLPKNLRHNDNSNRRIGFKG